MQQFIFAIYVFIMTFAIAAAMIRTFVFFKIYGMKKDGFKKAIHDLILEKEYKLNKQQKN